jgi:chromosome segregation ATPase
MDPQKLLVETQRAAGLNLLEDHTELRKLQKEFKVMERRLENSSGTIDSLKEKNSRVERDVQRISEREAIQQRIKQVGVKMVVAEKDEKAEEYQTQKGAVTVLEEEFERSNLAIAPLKEQLVQSKRKVEESKEDQAEFKNLFQKHVKDLSKETKLDEDTDGECNALMAKIKRLEKEEHARDKRLRTLEADIQIHVGKAEKEMASCIKKGYLNEQGEIVTDIPAIIECDRKTEDLQNRKQECKNEIMEVSSNRKTVSSNIAKVNSNTRSKSAELSGLDNMRQQRLNELKNSDHTVYRGVLWLRENSHKFKGKIYEPIIMELSVKHRDYADIIEGVIPYQRLVTFVCEEKDDYYTFKRLAIQAEKLRLNVATVDRKLESFTSNLDSRQVIWFNID